MANLQKSSSIEVHLLATNDGLELRVQLTGPPARALSLLLLLAVRLGALVEGRTEEGDRGLRFLNWLQLSEDALPSGLLGSRRGCR